MNSAVHKDYSFEALHRVHFCDAWRVQPVLDAPGSELVLPPQLGLLVHGCFGLSQVQYLMSSVSDRDTEKKEQKLFFPRVRTPCGHGAQVIVEERKNSLMVEKRTRTTNATQKLQQKAHRPSLHHHVVFPLCY